jgi:hypothetical protein
MGFVKDLFTGGAYSASKAISSGAEQAAQRAIPFLQPYQQAGAEATQQMLAGIQPGGQFATPFTMADATNAPAMQTALEQGKNVIQGSAAAKGGLLSSGTLAGLTEFGQKTGAAFQQQAFDQWLKQRGALMEPLAMLMKGGQSAAGDIASALSGATLTGAQAKAGATQAGYKAGGDFVGSAISAMFSDERLKENVRPVGKTHSGETVYTYRYKGGGPTHMGVMAQELERTNPDAVIMHPSGYRMVDYAKVD